MSKISEIKKFPCVVKYQSMYSAHNNCVLVMYNAKSGIVVEAGSGSTYKVGQVRDQRISFSNENEIEIVKMPYDITFYAEKVNELIKQREREIEIYKMVQDMGGVK